MREVVENANPAFSSRSLHSLRRLALVFSALQLLPVGNGGSAGSWKWTRGAQVDDYKE